MIRYAKGLAPSRLTALTTTPGMTWAGLGADDRGPIRDALIRDQGALCAYCQRRIHSDDHGPTGRVMMKIEHWLTRSSSPERELTWSNMLGVCIGSSSSLDANRPGHLDRHCDDSRRDHPLFLHPVEGQEADPRAHLRYTKDGKAEPSSGHPRVAPDIGALNLNAAALRRGRAAAYDAAFERWRRSGFSTPELRKLARENRIVPGMKAPEHAEFVRYHILKILKKRGETE